VKKLIALILLAVMFTAGCNLANTNQPPLVNSFVADPPTIVPGGSSTLSWNVSGATNVIIDQGIGSVSLTGNRAVMPNVTSVYTLTATNAAGISVTATAQVIVTGTTAPPPTPTPITGSLPLVNYFTANPTTIYAGDSATLSWSVSNATSTNISPGVGSVSSVSSTLVSPEQSTSYTLSATNSAGTVNRSINVNVLSAQPSPPPAQETFAVIKVVAATEPLSGYCPEILYADITTNGAGTVNYRWESAEGGGYSYTFSVSFTSAGTQRVTLIQEMRALPSGMYQLHVMSPNDIISNPTHYTTCAP
jgi:hypothetical protein